MSYTRSAVHIVIRGQGEPAPTPFDELQDAIDYAEGLAAPTGEYPDGVNSFIVPGTRVQYTD